MTSADHLATARFLRRHADQASLGAGFAAQFHNIGRAADLQEEAVILATASDYHAAEAMAKALDAVETAPACHCFPAGTCVECRERE